MSLPVADPVERTISNERLNIAATGKRFRCNFIEPGVVDYSDCGLGIELLRRETIQAALNTALSNPLTKGHISTRLNTFDGIALGYVDKVGYDETAGVFYCEGEVASEQARELIRKGWRPSCGYTVTSTGKGGRYNGVAYERELTGIKFHHLAIVDRPRYQDMNFRLNSTKQPAMNVIKFIKNVLRPKEGGGANETETVREEGTLPLDTTLEVNGKQVRLNQIVDAQIAADEKEARENAISADSEIEYAPGKTAKLSVLVASFRANEATDDDSDEAKKAKKEKADRENAAAEEKAKKDRENAQSFRVLQNAPKHVPVQRERVNSAGTIQEQLARGQSRYGSASKK